MSAGWQVGDLAECISKKFDDTPFVIGGIYRVDGVLVNMMGEVGLVFNERPAGTRYDAWHAFCFRKVSPPKHEACEAEFVTLLKRSRPKVKA